MSTSYDGYGRLLTYNRTGSEAQTNAYNGLDDRVTVSAKFGTNKANTRTYVYDPDGRLLGEYGASAAAPIAETIWLSPEVANDNGLPMGGDDGVAGYAPLALVGGSGAAATLYWVHGSHLGVPLLITNASGATATPTGYTAVGFPGQTRTLADLYYNRYRDYDTTTGRYIQADPIGLEGGNNPYLYAEGNPLRYMDPDGQSPRLLLLLIKYGKKGLQKAKEIWHDTDFDGPSPGFKHGNGSICQIRYKKHPVIRLDYQPIPGSHGQSRAHLHFGKDKKKHRSIDPRSLRD